MRLETLHPNIYRNRPYLTLQSKGQNYAFEING